MIPFLFNSFGSYPNFFSKLKAKACTPCAEAQQKCGVLATEWKRKREEKRAKAPRVAAGSEEEEEEDDEPEAE